MVANFAWSNRSALSDSARNRIEAAKSALSNYTAKDAPSKTDTRSPEISQDVDAYLARQTESLYLLESIVSGDITTFLSEDVFEAAERLSAMLSDRRDTTGNSNGETVETIMWWITKECFSRIRASIGEFPMGAIDAFNATIIVVDRLLSAFGSPSMFHRTRTIGNRKPDDMFAGTLVINSALDKTISEYPDGLRSLIGMYEHIAEYLCPEEEFSEAVPAHNKASRTLVWQTTREYYHSLPVVTMHEDIRAYFIGTLRGVRMFSTIRTSSHAGQSVLRGSDIYATYEQLVRLQNYLRTRGVEGEYEIDATRTFTVSPSGIQMRKCLVQSKWHEGKQQFLLDIETAWNDPTDILGIADTPGKNPVSRASNIARNLKNIRQASDQGELEGVRYRSDWARLVRERSTRMVVRIDDVLWFRIEEDVETTEWMRRLYGMATDITLMNVIAEAVARMAHRAENTPAKPERARHISITKRSIGPKQKVVLSARDELPESTRPVRHRPLWEVTTATSGRIDAVLAHGERRYTLPDKGWHSAMPTLPAWYRISREAFDRARENGKELAFEIVPLHDGETMYDPYLGTYDDTMEYLKMLYNEFDEKTHVIRMQTYRRSTAEMRQTAQ